MANGNVTQYIDRTKPRLSERLKLANVLVSDCYEATLCDFGLAEFIETSGTSSGLTTSRSIKGSARYMSPELLLETDGRHTLASDIITDRVPYFKEKKESNIIIALHRGEVPGDVVTINKVKDEDDRDKEDSVGEDINGEGANKEYSDEEGDLFVTLDHLEDLPLSSLVLQCWSFSPAERPNMRDITNKWSLGLRGKRKNLYGEIGGQFHAR
ncbi:hypothetical protein FRC00_003151 [Tulasnella sp. 408]|nr:hypothetical protein FRC00_003151 [Tulasnella sp. 408]